MNRDKLDFGRERIGKLFRSLFYPTLVGMVFNTLLNICDGMFVGHGVGSDALAAVNIVAPLFMLCIGIGLMFGIGASVAASIHLSEDNRKAANIIMTQAYLAGGMIFASIIVCCLFFTHDVLLLLGCSPRLEPYAADYLLWLLPGLISFFLQCVGMMLVRLDGSPKYAMMVNVVAAVLNIFLDWLMVYPMQMGIKGASIATSLSCVVGGMMVVVYFIFFSEKLKFYRLKRSMKSLRLTLRNVGYMVRIGSATFVSEIAMGVTMVAGNYVFLSRLGEEGVAAFSVGCYLSPIIFSISNAVAQSAQPIISFNYGAGHSDRVKGALAVAMKSAIVCGVLITAVMWMGAPFLSALFLPTDTEAYPIAASGLPLLGLCALFFAINITFIGYYQSIEKAVRSLVYTLLRGIVFVVPLFALLPGMIGDDGLWLAVPSAEFLTTLIILGAYLFSRRGR